MAWLLISAKELGNNKNYVVEPEGVRIRGRLRARWRDQVLLDLKRMGVGGWRNKCHDR